MVSPKLVAAYRYDIPRDRWVQIGRQTTSMQEAHVDAVRAMQDGHIAVRSPVNPGPIIGAVAAAIVRVRQTHKRQSLYINERGEYRYRSMEERVSPLWYHIDDVPHGRLQISYDPDAAELGGAVDRPTNRKPGVGCRVSRQVFS